MSDADEITARHEAMQVAGDWRGAALAKVRAAVLAAAPGVEESIKWRKPSNPDGVVAYSHGGLVGTLEVYKDKVKFTFNRGAELEPPAGLSWTGTGVRRAVDIFESDDIDADALGALFAAAAEVQE